MIEAKNEIVVYQPNETIQFEVLQNPIVAKFATVQ